MAVGDDGAGPAREAVLEEIRKADRFILVSHEHPDGDALGSLIAMQEILTALGKDSVMFIDGDEFPLPQEYSFFSLAGLVQTLPGDIDRRTIVFLDCGNVERNAAEAF